MALPVSFRWDEGFVKRIDEARGDVPRSVWVRRAVEEKLGRSVGGLTPAEVSRLERLGVVKAPAPSLHEQPEQPLSRAEMFKRATQR
jgi:hypothetical protein